MCNERTKNEHGADFGKNIICFYKELNECCGKISSTVNNITSLSSTSIVDTTLSIQIRVRR